MSEGVPAVSPSMGAQTVDTPVDPSHTTSTGALPPTTTTNGTATGNTTGANVGATLQGAKDSVIDSEYSSMDPTISQLTVSSCLINDELHRQQSSCPRSQERLGPVGQTVTNQAAKTSSDFKDVYGTRTVPDQPAATGQPLTQYHSMFFRLLSWQNPRATAITFASTLALIFAGRYVDILKYTFKFAYFILGVTASLEIAGKLLFDDGLASKMRPRKYWTIPRESLERSLGDVEQLLNFFVIEAQRVLYAENVYATLAVFISAFLSYWLIKLVPFWGLCLISTSVLYLAPLIYIKNREAIDSGVEQLSNIVSTQASQIKDITAQHTGKATDSLRSYAGEYSAKAQGYMGQAKASAQNTASSASNKVSNADFPTAPKQEPVITGTPAVPSAAETEPLISH